MNMSTNGILIQGSSSEECRPPVQLWPPTSPLDMAKQISIHTSIYQSDVPNFMGCRIPVSSGLNIPLWRSGLVDYHDSQVCDFLEFGWPIGYVKSDLPVTQVGNHKSALLYPESVDKYIAREVCCGTLMGPFRDNPLCVPLAIAPLQTVPKKDSTDRRVVCDLSFPEFTSTNAGIPGDTYLGEPFQLRYPGVDDLVNIILDKGRGCLMWKRDLSRAYRQLPIDPGDSHLVSLKWRGEFYIDLAIPFGLRTGSLAMQRTTNAFVHMLSKQAFKQLVMLMTMQGQMSHIWFMKGITRLASL